MKARINFKTLFIIFFLVYSIFGIEINYNKKPLTSIVGETNTFEIELLWEEIDAKSIRASLYLQGNTAEYFSFFSIEENSGTSYLGEYTANTLLYKINFSTILDGQKTLGDLELNIYENDTMVSNMNFGNIKIISIIKKDVSGKRIVYSGLIMLLIFGGLLFWWLTKSNIRKKQKEKNRLIKKIHNKYKEIISEKEELRFSQDKKKYLMFLLNTYKLYFNEIKEIRSNRNLQYLYEKIIQSEDEINFSDKLNKESTQMLINSIEKIFFIN